MKRIALLALVALVPVAGCSSSSSRDTSSGTTTPSGSTAASTAPGSTEASTTAAPLPSGWTPIEIGGGTGGQIALPCCGDDFHGTPSPALPAAGEPLADGDYFVQMAWPDDLSQPLELQLYRYETCSLLPEGTCEDPSGADNMGVDMTTYYSLMVDPGDSTIAVELFGFRGFDSTEPPGAVGTVPDLIELAQAVEQAYDEVFLPRIEAGEDILALGDDVRNNPQGGFTSGGDGGIVVFTYGEAPPILFQYIADASVDPWTPIRGVDMQGLNSVAVRDGQLTLMVYAGFYS